MAKDCCRKCA